MKEQILASRYARGLAHAAEDDRQAKQALKELQAKKKKSNKPRATAQAEASEGKASEGEAPEGEG